MARYYLILGLMENVLTSLIYFDTWARLFKARMIKLTQG